MTQPSIIVVAVIVSVAILILMFTIVRGQPPPAAVYLNMGGGEQPRKQESNNTTTPSPADEEPSSPETPSAQAELKHVIEAIYDAAMKAQSNVQISNLHNFLWLFPQDESGSHTSRTIPINVGNGKVVEMPVFALLHHQNLCIHDLKVKTSLDINIPKRPEVINDILDIKNKKYSIKVNRTKKDNTTIELHFKAQEPTEMYHRLFEKFQQGF
jgi:hypothetical protein